MLEESKHEKRKSHLLGNDTDSDSDDDLAFYDALESIQDKAFSNSASILQ